MPIGDGAEDTVGFFDIDLTAGGRFPAGTFALIRFHAHGSLDDEGFVWARVNNDTTGSDHRWGYKTEEFASGEVVDFDRSAGAGQWQVGHWSTTACSLELTLIGTHVSQNVQFRSESSRAGGTTDHVITRAAGRLMVSQLVDSLRVAGSIGDSSQFTTLRWWVEGYRP